MDGSQRPATECSAYAALGSRSRDHRCGSSRGAAGGAPHGLAGKNPPPDIAHTLPGWIKGRLSWVHRELLPDARTLAFCRGVI